MFVAECCRYIKWEKSYKCKNTVNVYRYSEMIITNIHNLKYINKLLLLVSDLCEEVIACPPPLGS